MNKKLIEKLKEKSQTVVGEGLGGNYYELDPDEFAKVIVKECLKVIGEDNYTMLTGKAFCTEIKRHFGIKE